MLLGGKKVGKTSLAKKYAEKTFDGNYLSTIGIDFKIKELEINKLKYKILLIDPSNLIKYDHSI